MAKSERESSSSQGHGNSKHHKRMIAAHNRRVVEARTAKFSAIERILNLWWPILLPVTPFVWLAAVLWVLFSGVRERWLNLYFALVVFAFGLLVLRVVWWFLGYVARYFYNLVVKAPKPEVHWTDLRRIFALAILPTLPIVFFAGAPLYFSRKLQETLGKNLSEFNAHGLLCRLTTIGKFLVYPREVKRLLQSLQLPTAEDHAPFVVIKGFHASVWTVMDPNTVYTGGNTKDWAKQTWHLCHCLNAWAVAGLLRKLDVWLARKANPTTKVFFKDYITDCTHTKDAYSDGWDLPLRYRQSASELRMDREGNLEDHVPKFAAYSCLANPIKDPVWVLPVESVLEEVDGVVRDYDKITDGTKRGDEVKKLFRTMGEALFEKYNRIELILRKNGGEDRYIHYPKPSDGGIRPLGKYLDIDKLWLAELAVDPNRIEVQDKSSDLNYINGIKRPLAILYKSIERADKKGKALRIDLGRRDLLIIDNRRALICRKEYEPKRRVKPRLRKIRFRTRRWLRLYYGFSEV